MTRPLLILLLALSPVLSNAAADETLSFNQHIRPILSRNCFACHGFDQKERKADLRLDIPEGATSDLGGYQAIAPGNVEASEVWKRIISSDPDEIMPPPDHNHSLNDTEKKTIRRWIQEGAEYEVHWSFITPQKPAVPKVDPPVGEIDSFIQARLRKEGLPSSAKADKETLVRRITLDLTGLPPTPAEIDIFLADKSPQATSRLIDTLMSRPAFGEHMARYWLDLARYADTHGLHLDNERSMWPYRDWVVTAFNENLPFDEFTRWQLAGDSVTGKIPGSLDRIGF